MEIKPKEILIIQPAFIGDVILATCLLEMLIDRYDDVQIDFVVRKSNESILRNHPHIRNLILWDKGKPKNKHLFQTIREIRKNQYDLIINVHRFASSGMMTWLAKGKEKIGYQKNPLSFTYSKKYPHSIGNGDHEVDRLLSLVSHLGNKRHLPKLYLTEIHFQKIREYQQQPYLTIAPFSVWFTKELPTATWIDFINKTAFNGNVYIIGAPGESDRTNALLEKVTRENVFSLCGKLHLLDSAALMQGAVMNYVNDSGPAHLCTAVNAPVKVMFCSTVPAFGFGPLSDNAEIIETQEKLDCRPCGLHGYKECPKGHFKCGNTIEWTRLEISNN